MAKDKATGPGRNATTGSYHRGGKGGKMRPILNPNAFHEANNFGFAEGAYCTTSPVAQSQYMSNTGGFMQARPGNTGKAAFPGPERPFWHGQLPPQHRTSNEVLRRHQLTAGPLPASQLASSRGALSTGIGAQTRIHDTGRVLSELSRSGKPAQAAHLSA